MNGDCQSGEKPHSDQSLRVAGHLMGAVGANVPERSSQPKSSAAMTTLTAGPAKDTHNS